MFTRNRDQDGIRRRRESNVDDGALSYWKQIRTKTWTHLLLSSMLLNLTKIEMIFIPAQTYNVIESRIQCSFIMYLILLKYFEPATLKLRVRESLLGFLV